MTVYLAGGSCSRNLCCMPAGLRHLRAGSSPFSLLLSPWPRRQITLATRTLTGGISQWYVPRQSNVMPILSFLSTDSHFVIVLCTHYAWCYLSDSHLSFSQTTVYCTTSALLGFKEFGGQVCAVSWCSVALTEWHVLVGWFLSNVSNNRLI